MRDFALVTAPISVEMHTLSLADPASGAFVTFEGRVRNHNEGKAVDFLEYEAYAELAVLEGARIVAEAAEKFAVNRAFCAHRTGTLQIGDIAVWVGVSAAHRDEAFLACRYIIDEIKHRLPVWKKEHHTDGSAEWVLCSHLPSDSPAPTKAS